jgi:hypothetical protein
MRLTPFVLSTGLLVVGLLAGTASDVRPERPVLQRGGWRVLSADFHVHTRFSDGFLSPVDLVLQAERRGLDVFALTEHNSVFPAYLARWFSEAVGGPTVLIGEEITTSDFHLIGVGLTEAVPWDQPVEDVIANIHRQGGAAIAAHPVGRFWPAFEPVRDQLDAMELLHPIAHRSDGEGSRGWRWAEILAFFERSRAEGFELAPVGSSDYHFFSPLGVCRTWVFAEDDSAEAIVAALKAGRTVVFGLDGEVWGDPALVALLAAEPLPVVERDYNYRGSGPLDRVTRTLGWLGMLGIVLFGPTRRRRLEEREAATSEEAPLPRGEP